MAETIAERQSRYDDGFRVLRGEREFVTYPEDSSLRVWFSDVPWRYDYHQHSAAEVLLVLEGTVEYQVENDTYLVRKDEILFIPPEKMHSLSMGENSSRLLFLFEPEALLEMRDLKRLQPHYERVFHLRDGSEAQIRIRQILMHIWEVYQPQDMMWNTLCFSDLLRIYAILGQKFFSGIYSQKRRENPVMDRQVISSAINYIDSHYREEITLEDVADFVGFSRFYFSRSFKQQTGYSFRDYVTQRRVQIAMELLINTSKPMSQVAQESGFGSMATFNRVFRDSKNCTPTQYRAVYGKF